MFQEPAEAATEQRSQPTPGSDSSSAAA
jgi:hypothetical protein